MVCMQTWYVCTPPLCTCVHLFEGAFLSSRGRGGCGGVETPRQEASLPAAPGLQPRLSPVRFQVITKVLQCCVVAYKNIKTRSWLAVICGFG